MAATLEREVKLRFADSDSACAVVLAAGGARIRDRRLQDDRLLDTPDGLLRDRGCILRIRIESGRSLLTFKGPVQPSPMKLREEIETAVGDGDVLLRLFEELGFRVWFRYQKYREEFGMNGVVVAVDETPVGTFVEIEGEESGITAVTEALGRTPADHVLDSYRGLFIRHCEQRGLPITDMLFPAR
ncbi:MAG TPA: class IV adenylate cyclase [Vicinamibacterales bacterium]|nr:class IV adenylate cyclase [Vicinamibacterales bacterium]